MFVSTYPDQYYTRQSIHTILIIIDSAMQSISGKLKGRWDNINLQQEVGAAIQRCKMLRVSIRQSWSS